MTSDRPLPRAALGAVALLACGVAIAARASTHDLGPWRVEVKEDVGAYALSAAGAPIFEYAPAPARRGDDLLPAGKVEASLAHGTLTLSSQAGPVLQRIAFEPSGNRMALTHEFSCRAARRVQLLVDDALRMASATLRVPAQPYLGRPFSFTTIQVKEVAPYTSTGPLGEKGELVDAAGSPGKGFFPVSAFAMESDRAKFSLRLVRASKNAYLARGREEVPRPAGNWLLRSQLKSGTPGLSLEFGDALDALTVDSWRIEIEMTPRPAAP